MADCKPECPPGFHYHTAMGHTQDGSVAAYERGDWEPSVPAVVDSDPQPWWRRFWRLHRD